MNSGRDAHRRASEAPVAHVLALHGRAASNLEPIADPWCPFALIADSCVVVVHQIDNDDEPFAVAVVPLHQAVVRVV